MNFRVYILHSHTLDRFYTGFTAKGPLRARQHRRQHPGWTGQADDWVEVFSTPRETRAEARELEKQIKARGAQRFLIDWQKKQRQPW
jgi:putative endonuclease